MGTEHKNGVISRRAAKKVTRKSRSMRATVGRLFGQTGRFVKSNPVRVGVGVAALALVVAKLKNFF
jgi:hypothetical protein